MTEVWFYHLERQPLERVLPQLIEKTLEKGWRAVIKAGSDERVEAISSALWTCSEDGFIPHGTREDGNGERQPVWITAGDDRPNAPHAVFLVDGAESSDASGLERLVRIFDGNSEDAVEAARTAWRAAAGAGHAISYWQQDDSGRWVNKAQRKAPEA